MEFVIGKEETTGASFAVTEAALSRHSVVFGSSGGGKSYFTYVLLREQLRSGCSLVALDAKRESICRLRGLCAECGISPDRVFVIDSKEYDTAPGFNPLLEGDPAKAVAGVLKLIGDAADVSGGRQMQFLRNAVVLAAWHGIPLTEVPRLLYDDGYRRDVIASPVRWKRDDQYEASRTFFEVRFLTHSDADRNISALAVENKFDEIRGARIFLRMFAATKNSLDFASLFDHRQEPGAVLICTGAEGGLTELGQRILAATMVGAVESASATRPGERPVVLCLDEAGVQSGYIAESVGKVAALARERNLRLLLAAQYPDQLPEALRKNALENSAVKAFFRSEDEAATSAARYLARRDTVEVPIPVPYDGPLLAPQGREKLLHTIRAREPTRPKPIMVDVSAPAEALKRLCESAHPMMNAVFLQDGRRAVEAFREFPPGSVSVRWGADGFAYAHAKAPPRPPASERWLTAVTTLEQGVAVLVADSKSPVAVRIDWVKPATDAPPDYIARCAKPMESIPVSSAVPAGSTTPGVSSAPAAKPSRPGRKATKKETGGGSATGGTGSGKPSVW